MSAFSRAEMEEMMNRWLAVNHKAEQEGNWRHLADFYTEDCLYGWDTPNGKYEFRGRETIRETCVGAAMDPYRGWTYPYDKMVIDETRDPRPDGEIPFADSSYQRDGLFEALSYLHEKHPVILPSSNVAESSSVIAAMVNKSNTNNAFRCARCTEGCLEEP